VNRQSIKLNEKNFETDIDNLKVEIYRLEQRLKTLHREKDGIAKESVDRVQLDMKREDLADKERRLKKMCVLKILWLSTSGKFRIIL
jgi:hypothetical protein